MSAIEVGHPKEVHVAVHRALQQRAQHIIVNSFLEAVRIQSAPLAKMSTLQGCAEGLVCLVETRLGINPNQAGINPGALVARQPGWDPGSTRLGSGAPHSPAGGLRPLRPPANNCMVIVWRMWEPPVTN